MPAGELENVQAPVEIALVQELLRLFGKAARAHQLYLPNNPIHRQALDNLRAGFLPIWEATAELALAFTENEVRYAGETVLEERTKSSDSLPWLFYKDGVRELTFLRGFDTEELPKLLDILQRVRKASPTEDDLLTMLWQGDFAYLRYRYVDMSVEPSVPLGEGGERLATGQFDSRLVAEQVEGAGAGEGEEDGEGDGEAGGVLRSGVVSMSDFDGTLYFLDEKEIEYIQAEVRREYEIDLRQNVLALLLDIFEQQADPVIRDEVAQVLDSIMLHMLSAGQFHNVAYLIRETQIASQRAIDIVPGQRDRMAEIPTRLSAPESLTQVLQSMDEATELPSQSELLELFEQLRGSALATVLDWLGRLQNPRLRPLLEQAAARLASQSTADLVKLIASPSRNIALEAIRRAGALRTPAAVGPTAKVLTSGDVELRAAAVQALAEIGSPTALQSLEGGVDDADRDVRVAAIRALQAKGYRAVLPRLETIVKGRAIRDADLSEKMAVFEAYGSLCGAAGVTALDAMLNGKSLFGRREDSELRACAAIALGRVGTPGAQAALRQSANEKDVVVRNAVSRALRGASA
jgi:hypothetical protein